MADDSKISLLPDADALDGAEISPLVQAGATKKTLFSTIRTWLANTFVSGPASSTQFAAAHFSDVSGKVVANSAVTIGFMTGEISGGGLFKSTISDGSSAVGYVLDTTNALSTSGAKIFALKNSGTEKFSVDKDGALVSGVLYSKVDGTLYLEGIAGQMTGNARGAGAIDLQTLRSAATQVASGANAVALGCRNTASQVAAVAVGLDNVASQQGAVALGSNSTASHFGSVALGKTGTSFTESQIVLGSTVASCGAVLQSLKLATTDATPATMTAYTAAMAVPARSAIAFDGLIVAKSDNTDGHKTKAWKVTGLVARNGSNSTRVVGTPTVTEIAADTEASSWSLAVEADDTNERLNFTATGEAATNIQWQGALLIAISYKF